MKPRTVDQILGTSPKVLNKYKGKTYSGFIPNDTPDHVICVFGSNEEGRHGLGTALICLKHHGAKHGQAHGLQGHSWGFITTDLRVHRRPSVKKERVLGQVELLYADARKNPHLEYWVMYCGINTQNLSGFSNQQFAEFFSAFPIPENVVFNDEFSTLLNPIE